MATRHRPGTQVTATITGQIQGGNLTRSLVLIADGRQYSLRLVDGVHVEGRIEYGGVVQATITGTVASTATHTAEVLYNDAWRGVVRAPHDLLEAR